jgi:hypothetical protein
MLAQALGVLIDVRFVFNVPSLRKCFVLESWLRSRCAVANQDKPGTGT